MLTTIVLVRMRHDQTTRNYLARRRAEGRTTKEIMRILKRYIAAKSSVSSPPRTQPQQPDRHIHHGRRRDAAHRGGRPWPAHSCPTMAAEAPESRAAPAVAQRLRSNP